jgi:hypothetical protein
MKDIFRDACVQCFFKGTLSEPVKIDGVPIKYIDCLRDNEDAKKHFLHTLNEEDALLWARQDVEFLHCLYLNEKFVNYKFKKPHENG